MPPKEAFFEPKQVLVEEYAKGTLKAEINQLKMRVKKDNELVISLDNQVAAKDATIRKLKNQILYMQGRLPKMQEQATPMQAGPRMSDSGQSPLDNANSPVQLNNIKSIIV